MPNILTIISDEHRRDAMGCMNHPIVQTPNMDWLAERGTLFANAYTPSPMCVPARAAIACGDYVHRTRYWDSATPYDGRVRSWMHDLRAAGVNTVSIGKLHFRGKGADHGFSDEILPMHVVDGVGWAVALLRDAAPEFSEAAALAEDAGEGESSYTEYDRQIAAAADQWIRRQGDSRQPWSAFVSFVSPHYPLRAPSTYYRMYADQEMDWPIGYADDQRPDHPELAKLARFFSYDQHFDAERLHKAKAAYYGLTTFLDDCIGQVITALDESGQLSDTLILYVSDHGDLMGDHGMWTKQVMYEGSVGVPMILAGPGVPAGHRSRTGTSLLDIAGTAKAACDLDDRARPGESLVTLAQQPDRPGRTVFSEYHDGGSSTGAFMVRWNQWKLVHYVGYRPQVFDMQADQSELHDLAAGSDQTGRGRDAIEEGMRRLHEICDPDQVNRECFSDQKLRMEELGGAEACRNMAFGHTPVPTDDVPE
jgi:choline-sulfatase